MPAGREEPPVAVAVTGQMVVLMAMVLVTSVVESAGQFVTVGPQEVIVATEVE